MWVIAVGTNRVVDAMPTEWRADLPFVAVDGAVATIRGSDVLFLMPEEKQPRIIVRGGANEIWHFLFWNGFRPRAKGLDQPVVFPEESTAVPPTIAVAPDSVPVPRESRVDTVTPRPAPPAAVDTSARPAARDLWTVSFAAVLSENRARDLARDIRVEGRQARVVVNTTEGVRIHRVVLGPFASRAEADRVGRAAGRPYWVFEGPP
jgi:cell division septation protein DedD